MLTLLLAVVLSVAAPQLAAPPIDGLKMSDLHDTFDQMRGSGRHEAIDILQPRGTPVHAVVSGVVAKLFLSKRGGNTIYLFDEAGIFCYYYAHLDHYSPDLHEGTHVSPGQVIAYVGSTGDADAAAPHLHFTIFHLGPEKHWWQGTVMNPYPVLMKFLSN
jgi:murein DD-endopeptidase MepM/ murein hydrolase activator NlpD